MKDIRMKDLRMKDLRMKDLRMKDHWMKDLRMKDHWMKPFLSRRQFLKGLAAAGVLSALPPTRAYTSSGEKKFLFLFASGGWDTTYVFEPKFGTDGVDMDLEASLGQAGNIRYTAGGRWPAVSRYFDRWASRTCLVNGVNSHSVGHDSCTQFMLTGTSASSTADWPTLIAANAKTEYALPHVVFSGPNYAGTSGSTVVRGGGGTLLDLVDADINGQADQPAPKLAIPSDQMVDAFVYERTRRFAPHRMGQGRAQVDALLSALDQASEIEGRSFEANLSRQGGGLLERALAALDVMRLGLARCAMIGVGYSWDTHGGNTPQGDNFEGVFTDLDELLSYMATTPGQTAPYLIDEVVVVMMSEMGRTPLLNGMNGKDHWPYTSVLLAGGGIKGNQVVGATDDRLIAVPVDFRTGQPSSGGSMLASEHLGAALLKLGGLDPNQYLNGVEVFDAVLR